jgi:hypothetical protein
MMMRQTTTDDLLFVIAVVLWVAKAMASLQETIKSIVVLIQPCRNIGAREHLGGCHRRSVVLYRRCALRGLSLKNRFILGSTFRTSRSIHSSNSIDIHASFARVHHRVAQKAAQVFGGNVGRLPHGRSVPVRVLLPKNQKNHSNVLVPITYYFTIAS